MGHYFFNNLYGIAYENSLSIRGISDKCGLSPSTLARYVKRGPDGKIKPEVMRKVAETFGLPPDKIDTESLVTDPYAQERIDGFRTQEELQALAEGKRLVPLVDEAGVRSMPDDGWSPGDNEEFESTPGAFELAFIYPPAGYHREPSEVLFATRLEAAACGTPAKATVYAVKNKEPSPGSLVLTDTADDGGADPLKGLWLAVRQYVISLGDEGHAVSDGNAGNPGEKVDKIYGVVVAWTVVLQR